MLMLFLLRLHGFSKFIPSYYALSVNKSFVFREYEKGCGWEIYTTPLSTAFEGAKFSELSWALYDKIGVVLFALQITDKVRGGSRLLLNPAHFTIPNQTDYSIDAFVIARNKASSDLSFKGNPDIANNNALQIVNRNLENFTNLIKSTVTVSEGTESRRRTVGPPNSPKGVGVDRLDTLDETGGDGKNGGNKGKISKWKHLRRSALMEKKIKSSNHQEVMHRLEDEHFNKFYYVRSVPADIQQVTIKSNVVDEVPYINNHLIIIGKGLKNLYDLIRPLRAKHLGPLRYIVILYPYDIPPDVWLRISMFDAVLIVRGSPLEDTNLRRAGIFRAAQVVVLADGSAEHRSPSSGMDALIDSDAIFAYQHVKRMNPQTHVVLEIVNQSNIGYLEDENNQSLVNDPRFSPQFASGSLFTTDLLDSIVCQAYYNPDIIKVINKLISGIDQLDRGELLKRASAEVDGNDPDSSDGSERDNPAEFNSFRRQRGYSKLLKVESSCLYQMSIPENLESKTYGALYHHLSQQGIIPLGLLRGVLPNINIGRKNNKLPYVYTNPSKDTELYTCDRVFVLSLKPEKINTKLDVKEWLLDLQMQKNKDKDKDKSNSKEKDGKGIENYEKHHKKLEEKINKFTNETTKKLGKITDIISKITDLKVRQQQQYQEIIEQQQQFLHQQQQGYYMNDGFQSYGSPEATSRMSGDDRKELQQELARSNSSDVPRTISNHLMNNNTNNDSPLISTRKNSLGELSSPIGILKKADSTGNGAGGKKRPSFSEPIIQETYVQPTINIFQPEINSYSPETMQNRVQIQSHPTSIPNSNESSDEAENNEHVQDEYEMKTTTTVASTDFEGELDEKSHLPMRTKASPRNLTHKSPLTVVRKRSVSESKVVVNENRHRPQTAAGRLLDQKVTGPKITAISRPQTAERIRQHRAQADEEFKLERAKRVGSPTLRMNSSNGLMQSSLNHEESDEDAHVEPRTFTAWMSKSSEFI